MSRKGTRDNGVQRMGRPSANAARQKAAAILASARALFSDRGYRAVSMNDIADAAQVSTRTLYKYHADKQSLFAACLEVGGLEFPDIDPHTSESAEQALARFAEALVNTLSGETSFRISMLVYREGAEFPELVRAAEQFQHRHLVEPLATYLAALGLAGEDAAASARLFSMMALHPWQSAITFHHDLPDASATHRHAALVAQIFVDGLRARAERKAPG